MTARSAGTSTWSARWTRATGAWVAFQTVSYARERVTPDRMRIHSGDGNRAEFVCHVEDAEAKGVPSAVRDLALRVRQAVAGSDVQALVLSPRATALLDGLRDIVVARARQDEEALATAMSQGRDLVLTYRPSLSDMLPPIAEAPAP
jgi:hypothetical protein